MKSIGLLSAVAGVMLFGLAGAASAAPISSSLPNLSTLSTSEGSVEQAQYWRHRRCHWVKHCGPYRCHWVRRCHH
jgi:hypothetical protein